MLILFGSLLISCTHLNNTRQKAIDPNAIGIYLSSLDPNQEIILGTATRVKWRDKHYWLTAAHVCLRDNMENPADQSSASTFDQVIAGFDGKANWVPTTFVDLKKDLCASFAEPGPYMTISSSGQVVGDKSQYLGYPLGIYQEGFLPWLDGRYIGKINENCSWAIPTYQGSSGSLILNEKGGVVGVISTTIDDFNMIAMGACVEDIREFMQSLEEL